MIDGVFLTEEAEPAFRAGRQAKVPYMIGANDREFGFFAPPPDRVDAMFAPFGADKDKALRAYDPDGAQQERSGVQLMSDQAMGEPARFLARLAAPVQPTYALSLLLRRVLAARQGEGRPARDRDPVRLRHGEGEVRGRHDAGGHRHRRGHERLLGGLREDRGSERRRAAQVAGLQGGDRRDHGLHRRRPGAEARSAARAARLRRSAGVRRRPSRNSRAGAALSARRRTQRRSRRSDRGRRAFIQGRPTTPFVPREMPCAHVPADPCVHAACCRRPAGPFSVSSSCCRQAPGSPGRRDPPQSPPRIRSCRSSRTSCAATWRA